MATCTQASGLGARSPLTVEQFINITHHGAPRAFPCAESFGWQSWCEPTYDQPSASIGDGIKTASPYADTVDTLTGDHCAPISGRGYLKDMSYNDETDEITWGGNGLTQSAGFGAGESSPRTFNNFICYLSAAAFITDDCNHC